jgi:hypothetical protein
MAGNSLIDLLWPYVFIAIAGWLATDIWRWLGVLLGNRIAQDSAWLIWVRSVAVALVAAVVARLILYPPGILETVPAVFRVGAVSIGFAVFLLTRQSVLAGIVAAEAVLIGCIVLFSA